MPAPPTERVLNVSGVVIRVALRPKSAANPVLRADYTLPSGLRRRTSTGETNLAAAAAVLDGMLDDITADVRQDLRKGAALAHEGANNNPRIGDLADWYIKVHLPFKGSSPRTIQKKEQILRDFELFCRARHIGRTNQLSMEKVQEFCLWKDGETGRNMAAKTKHGHVAHIRAWILAAVEADKLENSPVRVWIMPTLPRTDVQALSRAEVLALLDAVQKHQPESWAPIAFLAHTGWSVADVITLTEDQIKGDRITRPRTKTAVRLDVPVIGPIAEAVQAARENGRPSSGTNPSRLVFTQPGTDRPFSERTLLRAVQRAAQAAELKFTPTLKLLRASYGTWLAESGATPKQLAGLMGHADVNMTLKYYVGVDFERTATFMRDLFTASNTDHSPDAGKKVRKPKKH